MKIRVYEFSIGFLEQPRDPRTLKHSIQKERIPSIPSESKIPRCTSDSGHSDSSLRAEPQHVEKIIRVKLIQSGDKLTYGYLPTDEETKTKRSDSLDSSKSTVR